MRATNPAPCHESIQSAAFTIMAQKPIEASKIESAMEVRAAPAVVVGQPVVPTAAVVSQPAMVAGTAVPGVLNDSGVQRGQWTSSFCGCFDDVAICCITCVCPCITYGQNSQKMGNDCFMDGRCLAKLVAPLIESRAIS